MGRASLHDGVWREARRAGKHPSSKSVHDKIRFASLPCSPGKKCMCGITLRGPIPTAGLMFQYQRFHFMITVFTVSVNGYVI